VASNWKVADVELVIAFGFVVIEIVGSVRSTVQLRVREVQFPAASVVRTVRMCAPSVMPVKWSGELQDENEPASTLQSSDVPAPVSVACVTVVVGGVASTVQLYVVSAELLPTRSSTVTWKVCVPSASPV